MGHVRPGPGPSGHLHVGSSVHTVRGSELRALRRLQREQAPSPYLFTTERRTPMSAAGFRKQLLQVGVARREPTLLVAFSETLDELAAFAASHGWSLAGIEIMDLSDLRRLVGEPGRQTMFHPAEIEFTEVIERIRARIRQFRPTRVVIDSISELCHLAGEGPRYRLHMEAPSP